MVDRAIHHYRRGALPKYLLAVAIFASLPFLMTNTLANQILIFAIFAIGYNFLIGYAGELSFGHALFIGLGAYATVFAVEYLGTGFYAAFVIGLFATAVIAVLIGGISLRRRGIYFGMITLAFGQMGFFVATHFRSITNGNRGMFLPDTVETGIGPIPIGNNSLVMYMFLIVLVAVTWLLVRRILYSPFGQTLLAIRENETRATHLGYNTYWYLLLAFVISAAISGFAGGLYLLNYQYITPSLLFWTTTGEVLVIVILGGVGEMDGPVIGAILFIILKDILSSATVAWQVFFGLLIMAIVLYAPNGVYDVMDTFERRLHRLSLDR